MKMNLVQSVLDEGTCALDTSEQLLHAIRLATILHAGSSGAKL
mgnify:FL=1